MASAGQAASPDSDQPLLPLIASDFWQVASNPDLGELQGPPEGRDDLVQQPVDFAVWQAADGTWQLWSCIRHTKIGGNTRLFYGWEGKQLTDKHWKAKGIQMTGDPKYGENIGGMQAPHVVRIDGIYHMFYGDWNHICLARSKNGKDFERWLYPSGKAGMFGEGVGQNARDAMVIKVGDEWYCYYTAYPRVDGRLVGYDFCRTSKDLRNWSEAKIVSAGGLTGDDPATTECPHVVHIGPYYYLFRTRAYQYPPVTAVYRSKDPLDFGVGPKADENFVCLLPVAAPEIILPEGDREKWYIAALSTDLQGIRIAELTWVSDPSE
jgi:hypothetical protein